MDPFKNIRPYTDSEVDQVLQSLTSNESVQVKEDELIVDIFTQLMIIKKYLKA